MLKVKNGDTVEIIAGKDKGRQGKIKSVDVKGNRVVVEGLNMVTKHAKPSQANPNGGIVEKDDKGKVVKKSRVAKSTGKVIDVVFDKTK